MPIRNCYLPMWTTRVASGILAAFISFLVGSQVVAHFGGSDFALLIATFGSIAFGVIAAIFAHQFSFTSNIAGDAGYDGLEDRVEAQDEPHTSENKKA